VIWRRWGLKSNPYFLDPFDETALDLFVGRGSEVLALQSVPETRSIIFLETTNGLGATSLGNFLRFGLAQRKFYFTPFAEFKLHSRQDFLNFIASLIDGLNWSVRQKYLFISKDPQFLEHEAKSGRFFAAVSAQTRSEYKNQYLESEAKELLEGIRNIVLKLGYGSGILIQISVQGLDFEWNHEYFYEFREKIRPILLMSGYKWLFIGPKNVEQLLCYQKGLLAAELSKIKLKPLELQDIQEILHRRKERLALNQHARLPVNADVIGYLYAACAGSLTEIFAAAAKLAQSFDGYQASEVDLLTAKPLMTEFLLEEMQKKGFPPLSFEIMKYLVCQHHAASGAIAAHLKKRRPNVSKVLRILCRAGLLRMEVHGRNRIYYPLPEVKLAFNSETARME